MERLIEIYNEVNTFGRDNGLELTVISPGIIEYRMVVQTQHLSTPQAAHGGAIAGMMDAVLGVAALSATAAEKKLVSTVQFSINYLNPVYLGDELLGRGTVERVGNRLITASGEINCPAKNLVIARGLGTLNAYPYEKANLGYTL